MRTARRVVESGTAGKKNNKVPFCVWVISTFTSAPFSKSIHSLALLISPSPLFSPALLCSIKIIIHPWQRPHIHSHIHLHIHHVLSQNFCAHTYFFYTERLFHESVRKHIFLSKRICVDAEAVHINPSLDTLLFSYWLPEIKYSNELSWHPL